MARLTVAFTLVAALSATAVRGQGVLRGHVFDDSTRRPIGTAEVIVGRGIPAARASETGAFRIESLPAGRYQVLVRAIGYRATSFPLSVEGDDTTEVELVLKRGAEVLTPVRVEGPGPGATTGKMLDFERRRRLGFGNFMTRADLAAWGENPMSAAVRRVANVRLLQRPWKCGGGFAAASGRSDAKQPDSFCAEPKQWYSAACYLSVYVDGRRVWAPGEPDPPNVDDYHAQDLEGVEIYKGADLPAELGGTGSICGAILLWTRTGS